MIVYNGKFGGLCNRLFTFAHLIAFGTECRIPIVHLDFSDLAEWFSYFQDNPNGRYPAPESGEAFSSIVTPGLRLAGKLARRIHKQGSCNLGEQGVLHLEDSAQPIVQRMRSGKLSFLSGFYLLAPQYTSRHFETLKKVFTPSPSITDQVSRTVEAARTGADLIIGVHIRQGDYRKFADGLYYYETPEYAKLMLQTLHLFAPRKIRFLVCSTDKQEAQAFPGLDVTLGPGNMVADLYALAQCDYLIGPPSTFSQWASFYGNIPRYVMNSKCELHYGCAITPLSVENFKIHAGGFGKH